MDTKNPPDFRWEGAKCEVKNDKMKQKVEEIMYQCHCHKPIAVRPHWYY